MTNTPMTFEEWYATNFANTNDPYHKRGFENAWQASEAQQASVIAELIVGLEIAIKFIDKKYVAHKNIQDLIAKVKGK